MKKVVNKRMKICCMCKHWNGSMGPRQITAKSGGFLKLNTMKQTNVLTRALKNKRGPIAVILSQDIEEK